MDAHRLLGERAASSEAERLAPGALLGDYRILRCLGSDHLSHRYVAEHAATRRQVALKVLRGAATRRTEAVRRFLRETQAVSAIESAHLVGMDACGSQDGTVFMMLELSAGETLRSRLTRLGRLKHDQAIDLTVQILDGLLVAHAHGLVHGDLTPDSVFLCHRRGRPDQVKLVDFGQAQLAWSHRLPSGTPTYLAPERRQSPGAIDAGGDVYALGVMLFEMLTGEPPFAGDDLRYAAAPDVRRLRPDLPGSTVRAIEGALAVRSKRFGSVLELRDALLGRQAAWPLASLEEEAGPTEVGSSLASAFGPTAPCAIAVEPSPAPRRTRAAAPSKRSLRALRRRVGLTVAVVLGLFGALIGPDLASRLARHRQVSATMVSALEVSATVHRPTRPITPGR